MQATGVNRSDRTNTRTGLVLAAVALAFFAAIVLKYWWAK